MPSKGLCVLVDCTLNLDGNTSSRGSLLDCSDLLVVLLHRCNLAEVNNFLGFRLGVNVDHTEWRSLLHHTFHNIDSNNNGILLVEDGSLHHLENTGKDCRGGLVLAALLCQLFVVRSELIEQMINNISLEDPDAHLLSQLLRLLVDLDIEAQHTSQLLGLLQHSTGAHNILLVDWANV